jgi:hypothetical protein
MEYKAVIEPVSGLVARVPGTFRHGRATFIIHKGAEAWAPSSRFMDYVGTLTWPGTEVHLHPRKDIKRIFRKDNPLDPFPNKPYAFRAWNVSENDRIRVFVDETETPESVEWMILHEVGHSHVTHTPALKHLRRIPKPANYATSDEAHASVPEERWCNGFADKRARVPGLDRLWWRRRMTMLGYGAAEDEHSINWVPLVVGAAVLYIMRDHLFPSR